MREAYVRPPLVATEPGTGRLAVWRFRLFLVLVLAVLCLIVYFVVSSLGTHESNPGVQQRGALAASSPV